MKIETPACPVCGDTGTVEVSLEELERYAAGELVQNVWMNKSLNWRELFITGTHPECWEILFHNDPEGEGIDY